MVTKTFRAENMMLALQAIQAELGPDALVLSMREIPVGSVWQVWKKPGVEVVAATGLPAQKKETAALPAKSSDQEEQSPSDRAREEIETILAAIHRNGSNGSQQFIPSVPSNDPRIVNRNPSGHNQPQTWSPRVLKRNVDGFRDEDILGEKPVMKAELVEDEPEVQIQVRNSPAIRSQLLPAGLALARQKLINQGVDFELVDRIITTNNQALSPAILEDDVRLNRYLRKQFEVGIKSSKATIAVLPSRVICVVGASGSGKTSTCAKLASYYSTSIGKKVVWIEADTIRTGAIAEARAYTEALEIPMYLAYTPQELGEVVSTQKDADLILVDTPGCNTHDEDRVLEMGTYLAQIPGRAIYLVAPATMKESDLNQVYAAFASFQLKGLILTKMDETDTFGSVYNLAWHCKLPISYFTTGKEVLGHLKSGSPAALVDAIFDGGMVK
jgi:flagellar biosynthesis protein FlhF